VCRKGGGTIPGEKGREEIARTLRWKNGIFQKRGGGEGQRERKLKRHGAKGFLSICFGEGSGDGIYAKGVYRKKRGQTHLRSSRVHNPGKLRRR